MDLEVVGRHALLFDDDDNAAFFNSKDALVEWNSLLIDRYDVRHLLQSPPPPTKRRRRRPSSPSSLEESQLDQERYLDLPPPSDDEHVQLSAVEEDGVKPTDGHVYHAVGFSYGNTDDPIEQKSSDVSGFLPPFPVPESLLQSLPSTEKLHQIMARTALFVCKNGVQSEIVLRVKQGDNPTFGFLMPNHQSHAYFRFLIDHPEVLNTDVEDKSHDKDEKAIQEQNDRDDVAGGALSLLGSVYGSGEDEEATVQFASNSRENEAGNSSGTVNVTPDQGAASSSYSTGKDEAALKQQASLAPKAKSPLPKKTLSGNAVASSTISGKKRAGEALGTIPVSVDKAPASNLSSASKVEPDILEPPAHFKRMMEKIVEFILKNGKEFEAVLIEQNSTNGKFPFLLPSNQYHPYYLKVLQNAQESKQAGKSFVKQKPNSVGQSSGKRSALAKDPDTALSKGPFSYDLPYDTEKKEKFKMVIGGPKKDPQDPPLKPAQQFGVSLDAAAAILQAATRGVRNPKLDILRQTSLADTGKGLGGDSRTTSSFSSHSFSTSKPFSKGESAASIHVYPSEKEHGGASDVLVAKAIAKTAALAAANEADSSEACLTKEQKQKAERLKRAKMFAAMIKSGAAPCMNEPFPRLSAEPPDSVVSGLVGSDCKIEKQDGPSQAPDASNLSGAEAVNLVSREREGSSVPVDADTANRMEKPEQKNSNDYLKEQKYSKKRHLRSRKIEDDDDDDEEEELDPKQSRKKHRSHHSSHQSRDKHRHRKRHSSSKERESRRSRQKHHISSDDDHEHRRRSDKHRSRSRSERKAESEAEHGGKVLDHSDTSRVGNGASKEDSVDMLNNVREGSTPSIDAQPSDTTEVPSDLRAKVRAMLLATL